MNFYSHPGSQESAFKMLRRLSQRRMKQERCELCSVSLGMRHRHLLQMSNRQVLCACEPCAMRFQIVADGRFKLIPQYPRALPDFRLTDGQWESLALPINLAFIYHNSSEGKVMAMYPSPAGATESLLPLASWNGLINDNPVLSQMEPDVEALLINRVGTAQQYFIAPVDTCYELVGLIRINWSGLSGGDVVWERIATFFNKLEERSESLPGKVQEVTHA